MGTVFKHSVDIWSRGMLLHLRNTMKICHWPFKPFRTGSPTLNLWHEFLSALSNNNRNLFCRATCPAGWGKEAHEWKWSFLKVFLMTHSSLQECYRQEWSWEDGTGEIIQEIQGQSRVTCSRAKTRRRSMASHRFTDAVPIRCVWWQWWSHALGDPSL